MALTVIELYLSEDISQSASYSVSQSLENSIKDFKNFLKAFWANLKAIKNTAPSLSEG